MIYDMIYLLTAIGLTPGGSSTVQIYTQTIHRTTQLIWEECGQCPVFASYTLVFVLQLRKKRGKISVRLAEECQLEQIVHTAVRVPVGANCSYSSKSTSWSKLFIQQ
jgi:hypothetical protein